MGKVSELLGGGVSELPGGGSNSALECPPVRERPNFRGDVQSLDAAFRGRGAPPENYPGTGLRPRKEVPPHFGPPPPAEAERRRAEEAGEVERVERRQRPCPGCIFREYNQRCTFGKCGTCCRRDHAQHYCTAHARYWGEE